MPLAYFKHEFLPLEQATVSVATHALNYGTGCFEGIRAYYNAEEDRLFILKLREHFERFWRSCTIMRINPGHSVEEMMERTVELLRRQEFRQDVYIRPLAFKAEPVIKVTLDGIRDEFAIFAVPMGDYIPTTGIHVMVSAWRRLEDNAIPSRAKVTGSYVNTALAVTDAHLSGFDDAIFLTEQGHVAEGSAANLFMVREGTLITPDVSENILEGITRQTIMHLANDLGYPVITRAIDRTELYIADELFLVGTGAQISPITQIDHRMVGTGRIGSITERIQTHYNRAVRGQIPEYRHWLTPVE
ncbi:branched-chain amino acid aminotransferase [Sulfobacillus thermosulfidooxidans DSM 9293]|uniref:Branched-chain-amino-acid aminotransferase n=1 Tax=Sulfobacillus thermosulfidooxidans (strain DSM 9293 / VKM B-1269 / AT-1) TaxID=929705 RepID=A0A1W1WMH0_SULTA|nr:branched-chain amino acid transaminase [Sulfobacillus thermosulfidooxidans]SMC07230.1 branched-chain amino acid aminotransferase [Sulfobacillus thermosulfidooxidans DSM 9293]